MDLRIIMLACFRESRGFLLFVYEGIIESNGVRICGQRRKEGEERARAR